ncbi:MAG TPA: trehalose-6-phosphate synthase [Longimicrobium sp.]|jgi:trehalose 6-phosphate synthase
MSISPDALGPLFRTLFGGRRLVVVSNREPYEHRWSEEVGEMEVGRPAGGLTSALDPLMQALGGTWVAWGSGEADAQAVDAGQRVRVPPEDPGYTLRRIWLTHHDVNRYYLGFSNQFLWPICHLRPDLTRVRSRYWERYRRVNRRFAEAVLEEVSGNDAVVWFQDYHLALAPLLVRARRPGLALAHFWHIPFPPYDVFRLAPQAGFLLRGMLANDLMGFHLSGFADNFLRCAAELAGATVDMEARTATLEGHTCHVGAFPISIDVEQFRAAATAPGAEAAMERLRARYAPGGGMVGVGVDRMDYSKGIPEKLKALELLWDRYPELRGRFTFVQVAVPSRSDIAAYDELSQKVDQQVWRINERFGTAEWRPVHLLKQSLPPERLAVLYRMADVCIVSSLQDGMNLVAKEFVASQTDTRGVLVLSRFAGAAEEMEGAVLVNPYDPEACALQIRDALLLPREERERAMRPMQEGMASIYDWMESYFTAWSAHAGEASAEEGERDAPGA